MNQNLICLICGGGIERFEDYNWEINDLRFTLIKCRSCEVIHTQPLPTQNFLTTFYQNSFNYNWYRFHIKNKQIDAEERFHEFKSSLGTEIIDYGGGLGYFSKECVKHGLRAVTYDPYTNHNTKPNFLADTIISNHSLEHSRSPGETIDDMISVSKPGATFIFCVPNSQGVLYRLRSMHSVWAQPPILHIFHFSEKSLSTLLLNKNLEVKKVYFRDRWDASYLADHRFRRISAFLDSKWNLSQNDNLTRVVVGFIGFYRRILLRFTRLLNLAQDSELIVIAKRKS